MRSLRTDLIVGARPNFVKAAPLYRALQAHPQAFAARLVHTGQHYDEQMSAVFFRELDVPSPDIDLQVGAAEPAAQIGAIMQRYEQELVRAPADLVLVCGDVNSTLATALVAIQRGAAVGHVEAGLRSFDRHMPEEINRVIVDRIADFLFTASVDGTENLLREATPPAQVVLVGNVLIDSLAHLAAQIQTSDVLSRVGVAPRQYGVVTLHRPSNVDDAQGLRELLAALSEVAEDLELVFPVHPRTRRMLGLLGGDERPSDRVRLVEPLGYRDFLKLVRESRLVITDSGGVQEETTCLGIPCLTLRDNTERPITVTMGTNVLVGRDPRRLHPAVRRILAGAVKSGTVPPLWDGHAAPRIVEALLRYARGEWGRRRWGSD